MMRNLLSLFSLILLCSCISTTQYSWQSLHDPLRDDSTPDLEECRNYAAKQYSPGIPTGEPYLKEQPSPSEGIDEYTQGEWRPDRNPSPVVNLNTTSVHNVPTEYTGYPGELDYHPNYLDDILEKCMLDRGWEYKPVGNKEP